MEIGGQANFEEYENKSDETQNSKNKHHSPHHTLICSSLDFISLVILSCSLSRSDVSFALPSLFLFVIDE